MIPLLVALGITVAQGVSNQKAAEQNYKHGMKVRAQNHALIDDELDNSYADNLLQVMQEMMAVRTTLEDQQREYMRQRATAITAAGEAGVAGTSVDLALGDLEGQSARYRDRINQQFDWTKTSLYRERRALQNQALRAKAGLPSQHRPNRWGAAMNTSAAAANTYLAYNK